MSLEFWSEYDREQIRLWQERTGFMEAGKIYRVKLDWNELEVEFVAKFEGINTDGCYSFDGGKITVFSPYPEAITVEEATE